MDMATKSNDHTEEEKQNDVKSEDWCFVCHDGGRLRDCDSPNCGKAYHYKCVGQKISFLLSEEVWNCARHSCFRCCGSSAILCYMCPKAVCYQCINAAGFSSIRGKNGFCKDCMKFVLLIEGSTEKRMNLKDLSRRQNLLKEYYEIIKKQEGLTWDDLQTAERHRKSQEKRKSISSLNDFNENKRQKGLQDIKLENIKPCLCEEVVRIIPATSFASLVPQNVRLIYLTRSLVQKLLKQPESFEDKVKGTFVRVGLSSNDMRKRKPHQIVQVTGITKISNDKDNMDIKLRASNIPHDISIDMISDADFSEKECVDLREQAKVGQLKRPTVEELEQKARILHEDMVDDLIARELRKLQPKMDLANEKGWRREYYECTLKKKQLEAPSERLRLIHNLPMAVAEAPSEGIMTDRRGKECPPELIPYEGTMWEHHKIASGPRPLLEDVMAYKKQNDGCPNFISNKEFKGHKTTSEGSLFNRLPGVSSLAQEHFRKQVNYPVENEARPPVPLTTESEPNLHLELPLLQNKQDKVRQEQEIKGERTTIEQKQPSMCSIPPPLEGRTTTPAHDLNPAVAQQSNHECCTRKELDILTLSHFNSSKNITMLEDELKSHKIKMEEDARVNAIKIRSLEKKLDQMFEHHVKQLGDAQVQSDKELITSCKKSHMSKHDVKKLLEPIYRAAWTEALEEVKAKHLLDLDLSRFPMYDPEAAEKVDLVVKRICESFIQVDRVASKEATEKDWIEPNPEQ